MFKNKFRLKKSKAFEDIHYSCSVQFLDDSPPLSVTYQVSFIPMRLVCYGGLKGLDNRTWHSMNRLHLSR